MIILQGPRRNFEIGWGGGGGAGTVSGSILGGTRHFFLLNVYNSNDIGGHVPPPPLSAPRSLFSPTSLNQLSIYYRSSRTYAAQSILCGISWITNNTIHYFFWKGLANDVYTKKLYIFVSLIELCYIFGVSNICRGVQQPSSLYFMNTPPIPGNWQNNKTSDVTKKWFLTWKVRINIWIRSIYGDFVNIYPYVP